MHYNAYFEFKRMHIKMPELQTNLQISIEVIYILSSIHETNETTEASDDNKFLKWKRASKMDTTTEWYNSSSQTYNTKPRRNKTG